MKDFLENVWFGFIVLGAIVGAVTPLVMICYGIYHLLT